jgi:hypothetical protein
MGFNTWRLVETKPQSLVAAPKRINELQYVTV